jgi:hypothetical protein
MDEKVVMGIKQESGKMPELKKANRTPSGRWLPGITPEGARPFLPGIAPNPNGRRGALRDIFNEAFSKPDTPEGQSAQQDAIEMLKAACRKGNLKAIRMWLEWSLSKPPQEVTLSGDRDNPLQLEAKERAVVVALLGSIPAPENGGTEAPEQHEK